VSEKAKEGDSQLQQNKTKEIMELTKKRLKIQGGKDYQSKTIPQKHKHQINNYQKRFVVAFEVRKL